MKTHKSCVCTCVCACVGVLVCAEDIVGRGKRAGVAESFHWEENCFQKSQFQLSKAVKMLLVDTSFPPSPPVPTLE